MNGRPPLIWVSTNYRYRYHKRAVWVIGPDGVWGVTSPWWICIDSAQCRRARGMTTGLIATPCAGGLAAARLLSTTSVLSVAASVVQIHRRPRMQPTEHNNWNSIVTQRVRISPARNTRLLRALSSSLGSGSQKAVHCNIASSYPIARWGMLVVRVRR